LSHKSISNTLFVILFLFLVSISIETNYVIADMATVLDSAGLVGEYTSIAIGKDGNPIISYYDFINEDLKVVHCTSPSCSTQDTPVVLDSAGNVGEYTSIAIGNDGNPIISYYDLSNGDLKIVHCTSPSCSTQDTPVTLDSAGDVGEYTSIAIGSDGNPIISYFDSATDDLKIVHCTSPSCSTQDTPVTLDSAGDVGEYTSIAIGNDGNPIISYIDNNNVDLKVVHCTSPSCSTQDTPVTLDSAGDVGFYTSIAIGSDGNPIISYIDSATDDLKIVHCTSPSCSNQDTPVTLDSAGDIGFYTSIAISNDDNPIISYFDSATDDLKVVHCTSPSCSTQDTPVTLDSAGDVGFYTSIAIGSDGNPIISYYDLSNGDLKIVHCTSPSCNLFDNPWGEGLILDSAGDVGFYTSIAIGNDGNPIISYYDFTNDNLKVVHCTSPSCSTQDTPVTLDSAGDVGNYTSIAIDNDGNPIISYYDLSNTDLKFVHCTSPSCSTQDTPVTLDSAGDVGEYTSIAISSDGNPIISYYDFTNGDLKIVHCTSPSCSTQDTPVTLDSAGDVGFYTSIAISSDGNPIISYYDFTNGDLKIVHCTSPSCSTQDTPVVLDSAGDDGFYLSSTIGKDGNPIISYYDLLNGDLKVVHCTSPSCSTQDTPVTLDSAGDVGEYTSIAIGNDGNPIISYYDFTNGDLKIVHCTSPSCSTQDTPVTLDSAGNVGFYTSIAMTKNNFPIISYFDGTNDLLKIITQIETCAPTGPGIWIVEHDCHLGSSASAPENVLIQNNSRLTIPPGVTLDIDFTSYNITVKSGSSVWIKFGGSIT